LLILLLAFTLIGCSRVYVRDLREVNAANLSRLRPGMTTQQVIEIMGTEKGTVREEVYYQGHLAGYREVEVKNPYKSEVKKIGDKVFEIFYYYADPYGMFMGFWDKSYEEKRVTKEVLTPVIFKEGVLIGWGRPFAIEHGIIKEDIVDKTEWILWGS